MKKTCERCANCHNEYVLGGYPTPVCKIYGYLEEINNPHHDLDGEKCSDYTYPMIKISFDTMINEMNYKFKVVDTDEKWYGITYKEDLPIIQEAINKLTESGLYR